MKKTKNNDWLDQLADLIIDCFLWEWKSGRLANGVKDSYTQPINNPDVETHESNSNHQI